MAIELAEDDARVTEHNPSHADLPGDFTDLPLQPSSPSATTGLRSVPIPSIVIST